MDRLHHIIYRIKNVITNKYYVGMHSTNNLNDGYFGSGEYLKASVKKYGKENHHYEIIKECNSREELKQTERESINLSDLLCMNLRSGGGGYEPGVYHAEDHKRKISAALRGRARSDETKKKISEAKLGKPRRVSKYEIFKNDWYIGIFDSYRMIEDYIDKNNPSNAVVTWRAFVNSGTKVKSQRSNAKQHPLYGATISSILP